MHDFGRYVLQTFFDESRAVPKTPNGRDKDLEVDIWRSDFIRVTPLCKGGPALDYDSPEQPCNKCITYKVCLFLFFPCTISAKFKQ